MSVGQKLKHGMERQTFVAISPTGSVVEVAPHSEPSLPTFKTAAAAPLGLSFGDPREVKIPWQ